MTSTLYAIVDGAVEDELHFMLEHYNPPHSCLYAEPLQPELAAIAPYLVSVDDDVKVWLSLRESPWGIYLTSDADMRTLRQHLRKYLQVLVPDQEKPVFFRFYDPRNMWDFISTLSDWEVHSFLGPIEKLMTCYQGEEREDNFQAIRDQFPPGARAKGKLLKITASQYAQISQLAEVKYIAALSREITAQSLAISKRALPQPESDLLDRIHKGTLFDTPFDVPSVNLCANPSKMLDPESFAASCFYFCQEKEIRDDRSVRSLTYFLVNKAIYDLDDIPVSWVNLLSDMSLPGYYRVETLLLMELGEIPELAEQITGM